MATNLSLKTELARLKKLRFARRSVMYVMRTLLFITLGAILCIGAFMAAERTSNLYILVTEGMAMRAKSILQAEADSDLQEYFTLTALEQDSLLSAGTYGNYTINSYDYDLTVEKISVYPWSVTASVTVLEDVSMKGSINADQLSEGESAANYPLPAWTRMRYKIHLINSNTRWYITQLEVLDTNPPEEPLNTPNPNLSPRPMATPTPAATELPA